MSVSEYMKKHGITEEDLDTTAAAYESGDYPSAGGTVAASASKRLQLLMA